MAAAMQLLAKVHALSRSLPYRQRGLPKSPKEACFQGSQVLQVWGLLLSVSTTTFLSAQAHGLLLFRRPQRQAQREHKDLVLLCWVPGWLVNLEKSELIPQQMFAFVGIHHNLISFTAHPTLENWIKVI